MPLSREFEKGDGAFFKECAASVDVELFDTHRNSPTEREVCRESSTHRNTVCQDVLDLSLKLWSE